ncbi:MAG TPA: 50S ribosomal protein L11 methyltransferase [Cytophagales bacterium]|nr:50S ribosomal protein L11 methyltransferase [Cytophagales bacterium]
MDFIEVRLITSPEASDILIAELSEIGFTMFEEDPSGFKGYIEGNAFNKSLFDDVIKKYQGVFPIECSIEEIKKINWNEEWEKNFNPIEINGICRIRASFHPYKPEFKYDIVINPKMSFGTGHHSTTALMIEFQLEQEYKGKYVADIGCGTGILSIMAAKLGAKKVVGLEIEDWSVENARENVAENNSRDVQIYEGTVGQVFTDEVFDIVLANINKNVLLEEMPQYKKILKPKGELLLSGFYKEDIIDIEKRAAQFGLEKKDFKIKENWAAVLFRND